MPKKRSKSKRRRKKNKITRPYKLDKHSHARRVHRKKRHRHSVRRTHNKRVLEEAEMTNFILNSLLKTASSTDDKPYHYNPRHPERDPEYKFSSDRVKDFKKGFANPDVSMLRDGMNPHRGNYPNWEPQWYEEPHAMTRQEWLARTPYH